MRIHILVDGPRTPTEVHVALAAGLSAELGSEVRVVRGGVADAPADCWVLLDSWEPETLEAVPQELRPRLVPLFLDPERMPRALSLGLAAYVGRGFYRRRSDLPFKLGHGLIVRRGCAEDAGIHSHRLGYVPEDYAEVGTFGPLAPQLVRYLRAAEDAEGATMLG